MTKAKTESPAKIPTKAELLEPLREIENPHEQTIAQIEELYQVIFRIQAGKVKASAIDRFNELINRAKERHLTFAKTKTLIASYYTQAIGCCQTSLPAPLLVNMYGYSFHALAASLSCVTIILCELKNLFIDNREISDKLEKIISDVIGLKQITLDHDARTADDHRKQDDKLKGVPQLVEESRNEDAKAIGHADAYFVSLKLSDTQKTILNMNRDGATQQRIADRLGISKRTVQRESNVINQRYLDAKRTAPIVWNNKKSREEIALKADL